MNTDEPDDLLDEYRRASAAEAGAPRQATREAILAEARKAALRRQPVANDSRYLLRAVAGVAVIGVAIALWRQQDPQLPAQAPAEYTAAAKAETTSADTLTVEPAAESERRAESSPALVAERASDAASPAASPAAPPAAAEMRSATTGQALANSQTALPDGDALLRRAFAPSQQNAITPPASAWLIRDASGVVLRSGVADSPADLMQIATSAQRDFPQRQVGPWTLLPATTTAGTAIDVHVAELQ